MKMKSAVILFLILCWPICAQHDGFYWKKISQMDKRWYVYGYLTGIGTALTQVDDYLSDFAKSQSPKSERGLSKRDLILHVNGYIIALLSWPSEITIEQIVVGIDVYYGNVENLKTTIDVAVFEVVDELSRAVLKKKDLLRGFKFKDKN